MSAIVGNGLQVCCLSAWRTVSDVWQGQARRRRERDQDRVQGAAGITSGELELAPTDSLKIVRYEAKYRSPQPRPDARWGLDQLLGGGGGRSAEGRS